jgi:hypothetical protein
LISPEPEDQILLPEILHHPHWEWHTSEGRRHGLGLLNNHEVAVVICERYERDGCWRDVLEGTQKVPAPPSLIVCSRLADDYLWADVLNLGGYDVLVKPFDREEVLRVAYLAWHAWKCQGGGAAVSKPASAADLRPLKCASAA